MFSVFSHDALDACCNCIICTFNRVPKEGEYLYNRYLPVISMVWVAFLILFGICGPLLHEQEEVAGCSIGKTERRLYEKIVLLRHGESAWNKENRFTGWTDVDLTEKGVAEAVRAGELLAERDSASRRRILPI